MPEMAEDCFQIYTIYSKNIEYCGFYHRALYTFN